MKDMGGLSLVLSLLIVLVTIQTVVAIKCWDCRSDTDPKCADPFDNSTQVMADCIQAPILEHLPGVSATMCRKIRQKVHGEWRYFRSCAYMGEPGIEGDERFCLMRTGSYNIFMEYCTCNSKDGCNGARTSFSGGLHPLLFLVVILMSPMIHYLLKN